MKIFNITFNRQIIVEILINILVGYVVGLVISYINIFGSSQNAPQFCAMATGIFSIMRIYNRQNPKVKNRK
ncbi:hypothetical protein [Chryseobacterium indoltheticum]|nr:hypothetical protein [Chryseobacterium indoltheticum]